jgi:hypothetical protein
VNNTQEKMKAGKFSSKIPNPNTFTPPHQPTQSPIDISDLLSSLPIDACVVPRRQLLTPAPKLNSGAARVRAILKIVVLFEAEYGSTA